MRVGTTNILGFATTRNALAKKHIPTNVISESYLFTLAVADDKLFDQIG